MDSAESSAFSTSSRIVVYKHFPVYEAHACSSIHNQVSHESVAPDARFRRLDIRASENTPATSRSSASHTHTHTASPLIAVA